MKIGLFLNDSVSAGFSAICAWEWCQQMVQDGHETLFFTKDFDPIFDPAIARPIPASGLDYSAWWLREKIDLAMFYSLRGFPVTVLRAARDGGATVVIESDSDGYVSPRQAPLRSLRMRWSPPRPLSMRLRAVKALADDWHRRRHIERELFSNMEAAHWIKIESDGPASVLAGFLERQGREDLAKKIVVIPFAVRDTWTNAEVPLKRCRKLVVAGRLGHEQKNPERLAPVISQISAEFPDLEVDVHIRGEACWLLDRLAGLPRVHLYFNSSANDLGISLRSAIILLSVSRRETTPIQALEALCCGCTLVAPRSVPGYASLISEGKFGQTFARGDEIEAIRLEMGAWNSGLRDPRAVAKYWRERCSLDVVCRQMRALKISTRKNLEMAS